MCSNIISSNLVVLWRSSKNSSSQHFHLVIVGHVDKMIENTFMEEYIFNAECALTFSWIIIWWHCKNSAKYINGKKWGNNNDKVYVYVWNAICLLPESYIVILFKHMILFFKTYTSNTQDTDMVIFCMKSLCVLP